MRAATEVMPSRTTVREAFERGRKTEYRAWPVIDERGVVGIVGLGQIEQAMAGGDVAKQLGDLVNTPDFPHMHADQPLHLALERMGSAKVDVLPVVSRANIHHLMGVVVLSDVLNSYGISCRE
jgi:predicted transcriptional regulator